MDVGITGAAPLPKFIEHDRRGNQHPHHSHLQQNAALFGPASVIEDVNPDGKKVRGRSARYGRSLVEHQRP